MQALLQSAAAAVELPDAVVYGTANLAWTIFSPAYIPFEAALTSMAPNAVASARNFFESQRYPTHKPLPLSDPVLALFCMLCYPAGLLILYIFSQIVGKLKCRTIGMAHNLFLFSLSLYMWGAILLTALATFDQLWDLPMNNTTDNDWRLAKLIWVFYISKLPEFGDTFLMVLKQNYHQISFLHLYHHTSIFVFWFYICVVAPGGDAYFSSMLNSGIHVIMYGYYFFTMLFATGRIRRFFDSIKFMITKGQMTQFMLNVCQSIYLVFFVDTRYSASLATALFWYMVTLLGLFGNFLVKGQRKAKEAKKAAAAAKKAEIPSARPSSSAAVAAASARPSAAAPVLADDSSSSKRTSSVKRKSVRKED